MENVFKGIQEEERTLMGWTDDVEEQRGFEDGDE